MATRKDLVQVVSEINTFLAPAPSIKPIVSGTSKNRVAQLVFSAPKTGVKSKTESEHEMKLDKDGDLVVPRSTDMTHLEEHHMCIEYENSTSLEKVGLQVWRGAFLLADYIIHHQQKHLKGKNILEVGSGTGLTSVVAAMFANHVTATDINDPAILNLLEVNSKQHNKQLLKCDLNVVPLDFQDLNWNEHLREKIINADVILAADVVYSCRITTAFVNTLKQFVTTGTKPKDIFIAMEKRYVFTMSDLDSMAPMYVHFMDEMEKILNITPGCMEKKINGCNSDLNYFISIQFVQCDFPQYFAYERTAQLVLLHLKSSVKPN